MLPVHSETQLKGTEGPLVVRPRFKKIWHASISTLHIFYTVYLTNQSPVLNILPPYLFLTAILPLYLISASGLFTWTQSDFFLHKAVARLPLQLLSDTSIPHELLTWSVISAVCILSFCSSQSISIHWNQIKHDNVYPLEFPQLIDSASLATS